MSQTVMIHLFDIDMKAMEFKGVDTETRNGISAFTHPFGIDDSPTGYDA